MGNFYTNFALRNVDRAAVVRALAGRSALVTGPVNNIVVVFDEQSDSQDINVISSLAASLSSTCACPVLAALNHDDDILWYALYDAGERVDEYNSAPAYFDDSAEGDGPGGGDATRLARAFGVAPSAALEQALRGSDDDFPFAIDRHAALAEALGLPSFVVGGGYTYIDQGELPAGLAEEDLVRTP